MATAEEQVARFVNENVTVMSASGHAVTGRLTSCAGEWLEIDSGGAKRLVAIDLVFTIAPA